MGPLVAVVLAAGQGRRMGQTKQLLPWGESTVVATTLRQALASQVDEVLLVTGHEAASVTAAAAGLPVKVSHNPNYEVGEMLSSLQVALGGLPAGTNAILVMLADQPFIPVTILNELIDAHRQGKGQLIAPVYGDRRGNPVLIDSSLFSQLLALPAGSAPRQLFESQPDAIYLLPVDHEAVIQDLDDPDDYRRLYEVYHAH